MIKLAIGLVKSEPLGKATPISAVNGQPPLTVPTCLVFPLTAAKYDWSALTLKITSARLLAIARVCKTLSS